jgi:hypothetical protein
MHRTRGSLAILGLAVLLTVATAGPASAYQFIGHYEEHVSFALWTWGEGTASSPSEWVYVKASDFTYRRKDGQSHTDQRIWFVHQRGVFDGTTWTGEGMMGFTDSGITLRMQGYRIASASATFQLFACTDFWCDAMDTSSPRGEMSITATWTPAPGQATYGYPPSNGLHYDDWFGTGCEVDHVSGMLMWTNATPTATWTWNGVTRVFPENGVDYDYGYGETEMARGTDLIVCPPA